MLRTQIQTRRVNCLLALTLGVTVAQAQGIRSPGLERSLRSAGASVVVMDAGSGRVLIDFGNVDVHASPGSTLKPFVLRAALGAGVITGRTTVHCNGTLQVAGHNLACVHPRDITVLDAREALAESCNTYFAAVAGRISSEAMVRGLLGFGMSVEHVPQSRDERVLLALGMQGVRVSPRQLAEAYRRFAKEMNAAPAGADAVVRDGLLQSVQTGMAHAAHVDGMILGGKTGTVDDAGGRSHGWFAGLVFDGENSVRAWRVIVVYVPNGNGNDAAALARRVLGEQR